MAGAGHPRAGGGARAHAAAAGASATVLEAAPEVASGQTGTNSGVIHAGIYYAPGSLKAQLCVAGAREMYAYREANSIAHERCGKLIVARHDGELGALDEPERRGRANEVPGLRRLGATSCARWSCTAWARRRCCHRPRASWISPRWRASLAAELEGAGAGGHELRGTPR